MIWIILIVITIVAAFWVNAGVKYRAMTKAKREYFEIQKKFNQLN